MRHPITHHLAWRITLTLILIATLAGGVPALARHGVRTETGDLFAFHSVAEQEIELAEDPIVWQASELPTVLDEDDAIPFSTGFLYAHDAPLVVYRGGGSRFTRLGADDAFPVKDRELLAPVALRDDRATYLALELVTEDDAFDPTGEPFAPAAGAYVLELLRAQFAPAAGAPAEADEDEPVSLDEVELPVLLVVVAGELELLVEDEEPEELKAGDILTVDQEVNLRWIGEEPGVVLAAVLRLPEETQDDPNDEADGPGNGADDSRPTTTPRGDADQGSGSGGDSGDGASQPAPTPTPKPTEAPDGDPGGDLPADPPPTGGSGSGGVGVEEGPGDGECLYCAPAQDGAFEEGANSDPCLLADGGGDPDGDGLNNCGEAGAGTDPQNRDSDFDGALDGAEVLTTGSHPLNPDTDGDGVGDGEESFAYFTSPTNPDTDADGLWDGDEINFTSPTKPDTDRDCLWDGEEINVYGTNPNVADSDGDDFPDGAEATSGTSPMDPGSHPDEELVSNGLC